MVNSLGLVLLLGLKNQLFQDRVFAPHDTVNQKEKSKPTHNKNNEPYQQNLTISPIHLPALPHVQSMALAINGMHCIKHRLEYDAHLDFPRDFLIVVAVVVPEQVGGYVVAG